MNIPPKVHIKTLQGLIAQDKISREDLAVLLERPVSDIYKRLDPNQTVDFTADEVRKTAVWLGSMGYPQLAEAFQPAGSKLVWQQGELAVNGSMDDELKGVVRHLSDAIQEFDRKGCRDEITNKLNEARKLIDQAETEARSQ